MRNLLVVAIMFCAQTVLAQTPPAPVAKKTHSSTGKISGNTYSDEAGYSITKPDDWKFIHSKVLPVELKNGAVGKLGPDNQIVCFSKQSKKEFGGVACIYPLVSKSYADKKPLELMKKRISDDLDKDENFTVIMDAMEAKLSDFDGAQATFINVVKDGDKEKRLFHRQWILAVGTQLILLNMNCLEQDSKAWEDIFNQIAQTVSNTAK